MSDRLVAVFADPAATDRAVRAIQALGVEGIRVASPAPFPFVHRVHQGGAERFLGWLVLAGAIAGLATAIALQVGTSLVHPFIVGGKPVLAWPAFGIVMFELTLLGAGVTNFVALAVLGAWGRRSFPAAARRLVAGDRLTIVVPMGPRTIEREPAIRQALAEALEIVS
jgi:hypothetical protein